MSDDARAERRERVARAIHKAVCIASLCKETSPFDYDVADAALAALADDLARADEAEPLMRALWEYMGRVEGAWLVQAHIRGYDTGISDADREMGARVKAFLGLAGGPDA